MRTTLTLDEDVYESVASLARVSGQSLGKVVSQLVRKGLSAGIGAQSGLPTFHVPAGTGVIPGNRASELLDEEA